MSTRVWWAPLPESAVASRKIHLDFHNSHHVTALAEDFDPAEFAATLRLAHPDSVVLFAKDMHGYFYYPSEFGPEHPALGGRDLLGEQVAACRAAGIAVFAYYCTTWDNTLAAAHPEWLSIKRDGSNYLPAAGETPGWTALCMSNERFVRLMLDHTSEILRRYPVDGIWYDMPVTNADQECFCPNCLEHFRSTGLDPLDRAAQGRRTQELLRGWLERSQRHVAAIDPALIVDQNQQTRLALAERAPYLSNVDVEALPTGEWGYGYFPVMSRYARALSLQFTGLTGRFQAAWADFGGLKSEAQLRVEVASIVAAGGGVSVGDQLPPSGRLDPAVYARIGDAYSYLDEVGELLALTSPVSEAVLLVAGDACADVARVETRFDPSVRAGALGLSKLLVEHRVQFDVAEPGTVDLDRYGLVVIPDGIPLDEAAIAEITAYLAGGGAVLHCAAPDQALGSAPWLAELGVTASEPSPFVPAYARFEPGADGDFDAFDFALYRGAARWSADASGGGRVVARLGEPAFQRSPEHYTSHAQTPFDRLTGHPVALAGDCVAAAAFPLGRAYLETGYWAYSTLFGRLLDAVLPGPLLRSDAPSSVEFGLLHQAHPATGGRRVLVHAVNFTAGRRRGEHLEYFDEIVPVRDVLVELRLPGRVRSARAARAGVELDVACSGDVVRFVVPTIDIHEIVVIELDGDAS